MAGRERVFVYGTLKRGFALHGLLAGAEPLGERAVQGYVLFDTGEGYPGIVPGDGRVHGEVYGVDAPTLAALDRAEGVPTLYRRERAGDLWLYVWAGAAPSPSARVPTGRWS